MAFSSDDRTSIDKEEMMAFLPDELNAPRNKTQSRNFGTILRYAVLTALVVSYAYLLYTYIDEEIRAPCSATWVNELEDIYSDAPLQTQSHVFDMHILHTYFMLPQDPRVNEDLLVWQHDLSVGMLAITEEEARKLPGDGSAPFHDSHGRRVDGLYVVQTTVSHEMACLKLIRDTIWGLAVDGVKDVYKIKHTDHCIGYLRQLARCHADLTPIRFGWNEEYKSYQTDGYDTHQCRSWDAVWKWSQARNTTGVRVDGKHKGVPDTHT